MDSSQKYVMIFILLASLCKIVKQFWHYWEFFVLNKMVQDCPAEGSTTLQLDTNYINEEMRLKNKNKKSEAGEGGSLFCTSD